MCMHSCARMGMIEIVAILGFLAGYQLGGGFVVASASALTAVALVGVAPIAVEAAAVWRRRRQRRRDFPTASARRFRL